LLKKTLSTIPCAGIATTMVILLTTVHWKLAEIAGDSIADTIVLTVPTSIRERVNAVLKITEVAQAEAESEGAIMAAEAEDATMAVEVIEVDEEMGARNLIRQTEMIATTLATQQEIRTKEKECTRRNKSSHQMVKISSIIGGQKKETMRTSTTMMNPMILYFKSELLSVITITKKRTRKESTSL
jgi:hypothetical protein